MRNPRINPRLRHRLRLVGADYVAPVVPAVVPEPEDPQFYMSMAGAAALVLGGTVAIVSGPDGPETIVEYETDRRKRLRA